VTNFISVVIPALNEEQQLPSCLESLQKQDFKGKYEIIVVDNNSADNTARVARDYGARVIFCEKRGVVYARQAGAEAARGNIIAQADADTIYPPNWLSRIDDHFTKHPESSALAGTFIYANHPPFWANLEYFLRFLLNMLSIIFLGNASLISGANFAFRKEAFQKANGYSLNSLSPDQWGIAHRLSKYGRIHYCRSLYVMTSSRRVDKPFHSILKDVATNTGNIVGYFCKWQYKFFRARVEHFLKPLKPRVTVLLILISIIIAIAGLIIYGYASPTSELFGKVYYTGPKSDKLIALTFDDGPNDPYTSEILDILKNYQIKATFFVIGKNVELYPETAQRIIGEGHVIGNHSYTHSANLSLSTNINYEITKAEEVIFDITGVRPVLFRPPHGKKTPWSLTILNSNGMITITWNNTANDQHNLLFLGKPNPFQYAHNIIKKAKPGQIILMHDGFGTEHGTLKSDRSMLVQSLPIIISELQKQGYQFVTIPELLGIEPYK